MARLDPDFLEEGRRRVRQSDLDGLMDWVERSGTIINHDVTRKTFEQCFRAGDMGKAIKLFDAVFPQSDPALELGVMFGKLALVGLSCLACLGVFFTSSAASTGRGN